MKAHVTLIGLALAYMPCATNLEAQETPGPCPSVYPTPRVGHYAEVVFSNPQGERMPIRFAVVGEEEIGGLQHYWIEVVSVPPAIGGEVIVQMLVPYYPFENADIAGYVVKMPGQPAQRVPNDLRDDDRSNPRSARALQRRQRLPRGGGSAPGIPATEQKYSY